MISFQIISVTYLLLVSTICNAFVILDRSNINKPTRTNTNNSPATTRLLKVSSSSLASSSTTINSIEEASKILSEWDREYNNPDVNNPDGTDTSEKKVDKYPLLIECIKYLTTVANKERSGDSTNGRIMLGICASSTEEGIATLKSWVGTLELPRGLLHGMDVDGVPQTIDGPVYIKYNTGGCLTFADMRKSKLGFDALWKPGDALIEPYDDGTYRGVYYQVELSSDDEFRQYLIPLDIFY